MNRFIRATLSTAILAAFVTASESWAAENEVLKKNYGNLGKERGCLAKRVYEAATQGNPSTDVVDEKLQREMIAVAVQRISQAPQIAPERIFDFSLVRTVGETLR